ncbi:gamma-type small acid-soluble spore protein [Brevibacillus dissolubilis]|uniref:gamma-type small acid-soluble spore protein n=1 Tax=Brevibacillus dissolubilis TaxID=1844116 RepID=UPI0020FFF6CB|nr:gamma-type small acid-soluble spore protein [Brevibacillus dissolubilis]
MTNQRNQQQQQQQRNQQGFAANNANAGQQNTATEFATETNVTEVRRQTQTSANRNAQQQNNPTE